MATKFVLRGGSLTAYKHSGSGKNPTHLTSPAATVIADAAAIGGQALNFAGTAGSFLAASYPGYLNSTFTGLISMLARVAMSYSGSPSASVPIMDICGPRTFSAAASKGMQLVHASTGHLLLNISNLLGTSAVTLNTDLGAWSPVAGQYYDIVFTWDGSITTNSVKVYIDGVLFSQKSPSQLWPAAENGHVSIGFGYSFFQAILSSTKLNEFVLWDSVIDPTASGLNLNGSTRAAFVPITGVLDPTLSVDPGVANVVLSTAYTINGVALTGTADMPAQADVRLGTTYDNAGLTGSLHVPAAADVRLGVAVDAGAGTCRVPAVGKVETGTAFDAADALTGTYDGSDRWSDPGVTNVRDLVNYKANSLTNNRVGTFAQIVLQQATLIGLAPPSTTPVQLYFSQGDDVTLNLKALLGPALSGLDLTGATFSTLLKAGDGTTVTVPNSAHVAAPDQVANIGEFQVRVDDTQSVLVKDATKKEIITAITIGTDTILFHGVAMLNVFKGVPSV